MVEFVTLESKEFKYGNNNFIEVSRKKVTGVENENEFIQISKGFYNKEGNKRYKGGVGLPDNPELKAFLIEALRAL